MYQHEVKDVGGIVVDVDYQCLGGILRRLELFILHARILSNLFFQFFSSFLSDGYITSAIQRWGANNAIILSFSFEMLSK